MFDTAEAQNYNITVRDGMLCCLAKTPPEEGPACLRECRYGCGDRLDG